MAGGHAVGQAALVGQTAVAETQPARNVDGPVIHVDGYRKTYNKRAAVDGVQLNVRRGELYGLLGPDGAGKSSLMKAIAGVMTFDAGDVDVFGVRLDSEAAAETIKGRIGFMPQGLGLNLYPELSVEENIDFFARLRLVPEREFDCAKAEASGNDAPGVVSGSFDEETVRRHETKTRADLYADPRTTTIGTGRTHNGRGPRISA